MSTAPADQKPDSLTVSQVAERSGVPIATIKFYIREGLLPRPRTAGRTVGRYDEAFLNRVVESARGGQPTRIEKEYFVADKDAKKREKLLDAILSDPATAKKVGPEWKQNMLKPPMKYSFVMVLDRDAGWADKLIDDLLAKKKSDDQVLESLTLAATGRLPTDTEKKLVAAVVSKTKDKKAAWQEEAGTLVGTDEAKKHAERLKPIADVLFFRSTELELDVKPLPHPPVPPKKK